MKTSHLPRKKKVDSVTVSDTPLGFNRKSTDVIMKTLMRFQLVSNFMKLLIFQSFIVPRTWCEFLLFF